jgi:hypothetical protein
MEEEKDMEMCASWWESDKVDSIGWALGFIWAGFVLFGEALKFSSTYAWWEPWSIFFTGAGIIVLSEAGYRLITPRYRGKWIGTLIFGVILFAIGTGGHPIWDWIWILVLFAIGAIILYGALWGRKPHMSEQGRIEKLEHTP